MTAGIASFSATGSGSCAAVVVVSAGSGAMVSFAGGAGTAASEQAITSSRSGIRRFMRTIVCKARARRHLDRLPVTPSRRRAA